MRDHYEELGVARDAGKDEIKSAYQARKQDLDGDASDEARAELGRLNEAWQTLADPYQRGRYDAALESGDADEEAEVVDGADEEAEERPRRRGLFQPAEASDRPAPTPTVKLPPGVRLAENRPRLNAMLFDLAIVVLLGVGTQLVGQQIVQNKYPDEVDRIQEIADEVDAIDNETSRRDDVQNEIDNLQSEIQDAEEAGDPTSELEDQLAEAQAATETRLSEIEDEKAGLEADLAGDLSDSAAADTQDQIDELDQETELINSSDSSLESRRESLVQEDKDARAVLQPANLITVAVGALLGLVYLVGFGLRGGQTIGKRLRKVRVIEVDGRPLTFRSALIRYGLPAVFSAVTFLFLLGPLGFALAIFGVLLWMRNPNSQGLHDRLAGTLVVEDIPSSAPPKKA